MGETGRPQSHACLVIEVTGGPHQCNVNFPQGLVIWKGWLALEGFVACVEGQIGLVLSVMLP